MVCASRSRLDRILDGHMWCTGTAHSVRVRSRLRFFFFRFFIFFDFFMVACFIADLFCRGHRRFTAYASIPFFIYFLSWTCYPVCVRALCAFVLNFCSIYYTGYDTICIGCAFPIFVIGRGHIFRMHSASAPYASSHEHSIYVSSHPPSSCHPRLLISCWCSFLSLITLLAIRWLVSRI